MDNSTHYWFSFALIILNTVLMTQRSLYEQILILIIVIPLNLISIVPNVLDKFFCVDRKTRICTERCRHPITHHPMLFILLIAFLSVIDVSSQYYFLYHILSEIILLSFGSHLVLDMVSKEGIPLSFSPTLFSQDQSKNYGCNETTTPKLRLKIPKIILSRDDYRTNLQISMLCKGIVALYCFQLFYNVIQSSNSMEFILRSLTQFPLNIYYGRGIII